MYILTYFNGFNFLHVEFEVPEQFSGREILQVVGHMGVKLMRTVRAKDTDLESIAYKCKQGQSL